MKTSAKFILKKSQLLQDYKEIKNNCDEISYSAKTNYEVAKILREETDCMFSVHSEHALKQIQDPKRCWYFLQADSKEIIKNLMAQVHGVVVDNKADLETVQQVLSENQDLNTALLLRMKLKEHTLHTGKYFVYGMSSDTVKKEIHNLKNNKQITQLGIHFHRKSQNISEWNLKYELKSVLDEQTMQSIQVLNMGGGIPVQYKNFDAKVMDRIYKAMKELREWLDAYQIKLVTEPGRALAAPCIKLIAPILLKYNNNIVIDCSVFNTSMDTFVVHHKLQVEGELEKNQGQAYTIKGRTPDSMDIFRYRVYLDEPNPGDNITFLNAGAYNYATDFCGLEKPPTEVVE